MEGNLLDYILTKGREYVSETVAAALLRLENYNNRLDVLENSLQINFTLIVNQMLNRNGNVEELY